MARIVEAKQTCLLCFELCYVVGDYGRNNTVRITLELLLMHLAGELGCWVFYAYLYS